MRPVGTTKERLPVYEEEFLYLIHVTKQSHSLDFRTKAKLLRAYTLLYLTGCRVSEIVNLTTDDIKEIRQKGHISLTNDTKTRTPRLLIFSDLGVALLSALPYTDIPEIGSDKKYLFYAKGKTLPMSKAKLTHLLNTHIKKSLGELYTTHSFRAGYITRIVEATGNIKTAQDLVGHSSIKTTMSYLSTSVSRKKDAINKVFG